MHIMIIRINLNKRISILSVESMYTEISSIQDPLQHTIVQRAATMSPLVKVISESATG